MAVDMSPFLSSIAFDTVVVCVLSFAGSFAALLVVRNGAGKLLAMLRDQEMADQARKREADFEKRYARERRDREYREWKGRKGF